MRKKKKKSKRVPVPDIPPLSLKALGDVQEIERYAHQEIRDCHSSSHLNTQKAQRILRTCAVQVLRIQLAYYQSLPIFHEKWVIKLQADAIESAVGMIPGGYEDDLYQYFRDILWKTTYDDLNPPKSKRIIETKTVAQQIDALRSECRMTVEELATALDIEPRSIYRHLSNKAKPRQRQIAAYERLFSERLERSVRLETSV
jgi:hypothetical protein